MKNLLITCLFSVLLFSACRSGEEKKVVNTTETPTQIEQVEQESEILENTANEIDTKAAALEDALNDLDK